MASGNSSSMAARQASILRVDDIGHLAAALDAALEPVTGPLGERGTINTHCVPATATLSDAQAQTVAATAIALCARCGGFYLLDPPQQATTRDTPDAIVKWLAANDTLRSRNAALYVPRIIVPDPVADFAPRICANSGAIAGIYARTDVATGVWKAPAGIQAGLADINALAYPVSDQDNSVLNPLAINALRLFAVYGPVVWGARTLAGADQMADEYKYVPTRRLALYIEQSLIQSLQWAVFEPNDAALWSSIRLSVGSFMQDLFRAGAFMGTTAQDSYFVQCDATTTTPSDIENGVVNVLIGFAPVHPAEFVVITIQQAAGQQN